MAQKSIKFILVQIDEAHSTAWPIGLPITPNPQKSFEERVERANKFVETDKPPKEFTIVIDSWDNKFANKFRAWPDKFYLIDNDYKVIKKSQYGTEGEKDALIVEDSLLLLKNLLNK